MALPESEYRPDFPLVTRATLIADAVLVPAFFAFMYWLVSGHVPSSETRFVVLWGAAGAACLTGVFWLALQMLRVMWRAQRNASKKQR
ncbi:hypothetical protein OH491_02505 [Termitidicoccus mucosus]|uniref:Uncharacterized protein n=1 Tax=Termitidicoccus mucosus TaxID=1184151 RepID=A0A178ILP8_9BACT|nr:hypothetical protein AW736_07045 [Opitutaceae bacterium TSB47]